MTERHRELKQMLHERRRELEDQVQSRMRSMRDGRPLEVPDEGDHCEHHVQDDIALGIIQLNAEQLVRVDEALDRLEAGEYGNCLNCGDEIPSNRLRALPFAVRCRTCEESLERTLARSRREEHRIRPFLSSEGTGPYGP